MTLEDVVGESEQAEDLLDFEEAAHHKLTQVPLPESGVNTFAHGPSLVDGLAVRTLHSLAPGGDPGTVVAARRIGVGVVLASDRRAINVDADAGGPFGVFILVEATID